MIERTKHGVFIPNEDLPAILGILGGFKSHMENDVKPDLPGSLEPFYEHIMDAVERLNLAIKEPV